MGFKQLFFSLLSVFLSISSVLADPPVQEIPEEFRQQLATTFRIPTDGKHMERILEGIQKGGSIQNQEDVSSNTEVFRHIKGSSGIPFPNDDQIKASDIVKDSKEKMEEIAKQNYEEYEKFSIDNFPSIGDCKRDFTEKEPLGLKVDHKAQQRLLTDILFVRAKELPEKYREVFGKDVFVLLYSDDQPVSKVEFSRLGVKCLPTRRRVTGKYSFHHEGLDALKNYDLTPNGKGKLNKELKKQLGNRKGFKKTEEK